MIYGNKLVNTIHVATKPLRASRSNLADMLTIVNPIDFGGHSSKVKVTMVIIDKCWVRGDATLCVVIIFVMVIHCAHFDYAHQNVVCD